MMKVVVHSVFALSVCTYSLPKVEKFKNLLVRPLVSMLKAKYVFFFKKFGSWVQSKIAYQSVLILPKVEKFKRSASRAAISS